jgi:hypothetical protein
MIGLGAQLKPFAVPARARIRPAFCLTKPGVVPPTRPRGHGTGRETVPCRPVAFGIVSSLFTRQLFDSQTQLANSHFSD